MDQDKINQVCTALNCEYTFYYESEGEEPVCLSNQPKNHHFLTASIIKVPILFAWVMLEREGKVSSDEICSLQEEPIVEGAGFSYLFRQKELPYADILTMMIAVSDNFCTNLIISKVGFELFNQTFQNKLGLEGTHLGRKMMDSAARREGRDNWITTADMIRCFSLIDSFSEAEQKFVKERLAVCGSTNLFMRNIKEDSLIFYHKSGGLSDVKNEWGFTDHVRLFLLTNHYENEISVCEAFGKLGRMLLK